MTAASSRIGRASGSGASTAYRQAGARAVGHGRALRRGMVGAGGRPGAPGPEPGTRPRTDGAPRGQSSGGTRSGPPAGHLGRARAPREPLRGCCPAGRMTDLVAARGPAPPAPVQTRRPAGVGGAAGRGPAGPRQRAFCRTGERSARAVGAKGAETHALDRAASSSPGRRPNLRATPALLGVASALGSVGRAVRDQGCSSQAWRALTRTTAPSLASRPLCAPTRPAPPRPGPPGEAEGEPGRGGPPWQDRRRLQATPPRGQPRPVAWQTLSGGWSAPGHPGGCCRTIFHPGGSSTRRRCAGWPRGCSEPWSTTCALASDAGEPARLRRLQAPPLGRRP